MEQQLTVKDLADILRYVRNKQGVIRCGYQNADGAIVDLADAVEVKLLPCRGNEGQIILDDPIIVYQPTAWQQNRQAAIESLEKLLVELKSGGGEPYDQQAAQRRHSDAINGD